MSVGDEEIHVFGFGSFFTEEKTYNDIDLLLLHNDLSSGSRRFAIECKHALGESSLNLHITMLSLPEEKSLKFISSCRAEKIHVIRIRQVADDVNSLLEIIKNKASAMLICSQN